DSPYRRGSGNGVLHVLLDHHFLVVATGGHVRHVNGDQVTLGVIERDQAARPADDLVFGDVGATPHLPHAIQHERHVVDPLVADRVGLLLQVEDDLHGTHAVELIGQWLERLHYERLLPVPPVGVGAVIGHGLPVHQNGVALVLPVV